jgi:hypothetical protein
VMCVDSGETAKILFGSVRSLGGFGSAMEDVRELPALAEQYFLAEDENSCGASGAHSTRYTIVNQTWKVFPVNGYQVKLEDPDVRPPFWCQPFFCSQRNAVR